MKPVIVVGEERRTRVLAMNVAREDGQRLCQFCKLYMEQGAMAPAAPRVQDETC